MRLYDKLLTTPGTILDEAFCGAFTTLAQGLRQSQCFLLSPNLAAACEEVCWSKPSSILSAQKMLRVPYQHTWIEWELDDRLKEHTRENTKPKPLRMGCYIHTNKEGTKGTAHYCWEHRISPELKEKYGADIPGFEDMPEITLDPFGIIFDFADGAEPAMVQYARSIGMNYTEEDLRARNIKAKEAYRDAMRRSEKWRYLAKDENEVEAYMKLDESTGIIPLTMCEGMFRHPSLGQKLRAGQKMFEDFMEDLSGEFIYIEAFLLMLNTRNRVVTQTKEDLSRMNKARLKNRRSPFREFIITDLVLNKSHITRAGVTGMTRAEARRHLVRGHFKTRKSGSYWYSAHMRSHGENSPVTRKHYEVDIERRPE